jgi:hypothetical protein
MKTKDNGGRPNIPDPMDEMFEAMGHKVVDVTPTNQETPEPTQEKRYCGWCGKVWKTCDCTDNQNKIAPTATPREEKCNHIAMTMGCECGEPNDKTRNHFCVCSGKGCPIVSPEQKDFVEGKWEKRFDEWLLNEFDHPPERQTHRWVFCADTPEIRDSDNAYDCACCFGFIGDIDCGCVCHARISHIKDFIRQQLATAKEQGRTEVIASVREWAYRNLNAPIEHDALITHLTSLEAKDSQRKI